MALPNPPGPAGFDALLRALSTAQANPIDLFVAMRKEYGDIVFLDIFIRENYFLFKPEYFRHVLSENYQNYRKGSPYEKAELFLGQGMLNSEGSFWKRQRKLAQPAFLKSQVALFSDMMLKHCSTMGDEWAQQSEPFNMHDEMMRLTMNIIADAMFSMNLSKEAGNVAEALAFLNEFASDRIRRNFNMPVLVPTPENLKFMMYSGRLNRLMYNIISERRSASPAQMSKDLLTALILSKDEETGEGMSDKELRDELMTIFLAGHETTAMAMTMFFTNLAANPEVYRQVADEVRSVEIATVADLARLPYTTMVILENLRINPPAWIVGRRALADDEIGGYLIKKDIDISMPIILTHTDPQYYERPAQFYPEHFSEQAVKARPKFSYLPFGAGPRICIGKSFAEQEMLLIAWYFLKNFELQHMGNQVELEPLFTLRPKEAIMFTARKAGSKARANQPA